LLGIPWRTAFALQDDGWILRNDIVWSKPNAMPESVSDRLSSRHEHLFMFSKSRTYWFDLDPIREPAATADPLDPSYRANGKSTGRRKPVAVPPGATAHALETGRRDGLTRNPGDVWTVPTQPFAEAHFAVMPQALAERAILAGCKPGGTVLDPFSGSGTTGYAANKHGRKYVGIDLNADYLDLSLRTRFAQPGLDLAGESA
jgi:site-specific DNA-methyltransferase (cytosine-N4-specific)